MIHATHLETERLILRALATPDEAFIAEMIADEQVRRFLGGPVPAAHRAEAARGYFRRESDEAAWLVEAKEPRKPIGLIFISNHKDGTDRELSFMFHPSAWGIGYATEAAGKILDYAIRELGFVRLVAETQLLNHASRALLVRIGMSEARRIGRFGAEQLIYTT